MLCLIILQIKSIAPLGSKKFDFQNYSSLGKEKTLNEIEMFLVFGKMFAISNLKDFLMGAKL